MAINILHLHRSKTSVKDSNPPDHIQWKEIDDLLESIQAKLERITE